MSGAKENPVGYRRPPLHSRFAKGVSGNPAGRPKGSRNVSTVIAAALAERVTINENGRRRSITKLEAAAKQLANKAATGDQKAAKLILELLHQSEARDEARAIGLPLTPEAQRQSDAVILAALRSRLVVTSPRDDSDV